MTRTPILIRLTMGLAGLALAGYGAFELVTSPMGLTTILSIFMIVCGAVMIADGIKPK